MISLVPDMRESPSQLVALMVRRANLGGDHDEGLVIGSGKMVPKDQKLGTKK